MTCALTIDVHRSDEPSWIARSSAALSERALLATYFVPTSLLSNDEVKAALRRASSDGHQIGTHGHHHDARERLALGATGTIDLEFLSRSAATFADVFGRSARAFRSPCWCGLSERTLDTLAALDYHVDSSSTPQRLGLLSSSPFENAWLLSGRRPHFLRPGLLEVPTTCFVVPFGTMALAAVRDVGGRALVSAFATEARLRGVVVNLQLHPADFVPDRSYRGHNFTWRGFLPRSGGMAVRRWLSDLEPGRLHRRVWSAIERLREGGFLFTTLDGVYARVVGSEFDTSEEGARSSRIAERSHG